MVSKKQIDKLRQQVPEPEPQKPEVDLSEVSDEELRRLLELYGRAGTEFDDEGEPVEYDWEQLTPEEEKELDAIMEKVNVIEAGGGK